MPIYNFKCDACGKECETVLKITHTKGDQPFCCGFPMEKQPSSFNAHFKGGGFHATDYRAPTRGF